MEVGALLLLLLLLSGKKKGSPVSTTPAKQLPSADRKDFQGAWRDRCTALMKRAKGGAAWAPRMAKRLGSDAAGAAAGRWIGIESGGDPRISSKLGERGLAQVSEQSLKELGLSAADYAAMINARTTDDQHADFAARVIFGEVVAVIAGGSKCPDPGWGPPLGPSVLTGNAVTVAGIGAGKLRHGLPLLVKELRDGGYLKTSILATITAMLGGAGAPVNDNGARLPFKPSDRLASFGKGSATVTGDPVKDLIIRFFGSVAVICFAESAADLANAFPAEKVS